MNMLKNEDRIDERLLLEEPEDNPGPETGPAKDPVADAKADKKAVASLISNEITAAYGDIDALNSLSATIREGFPGLSEIADLLDAIGDDRTIHVGMLQRAYEILGDGEGLTDAGRDVADDIAPKVVAQAEGGSPEGGEEED